MNVREMQRYLIGLLAMLCISCGGGSGGGNAASSEADITGQAITGAPMSNAAISMMIPMSGKWVSLGKADNDGNFTIVRTTAYNYPLLVKAKSSDGSKTLYSLIENANQSTLSINPLTSVQVTLALENVGSIYYQSILDQTTLNSAKVKLDTIFSNVFNSAGIEPKSNYFSHTFTPNHTGLDLILDSIDVQYMGGGKSSITNKITGQNIIASKSSPSILPFTAANLASMENMPIQACAAMLDGLTSARMLEEDSIYAPNFLDSGLTKDGFRTSIRSIISSGSEFKLSTPVFAGVDANGSYIFNFNIVNLVTKDFLASFEMPVTWVNSSNDCRLTGNQFPFEITVQPIIRKLTRTDGVSSSNIIDKSKGMEIKVGGEPFQNSLNGTVIAKALVELCDSSNVCQLIADLTAPSGTGVFELTDQNAGDHYVIPNPSFSLFNTLPNPIRVKLLDSSNNVLGIFFTRSKGQPFTDEELRSIVMPTISNAGAVIGTHASSPLSSGVPLSYDSGSTVLTSIHVGSRSVGSSSDKNTLILSDIPDSIVIPLTDVPNAGYRAIWVNGQLPSRAGKIITKYIWAPQVSLAW